MNEDMQPSNVKPWNSPRQSGTLPEKIKDAIYLFLDPFQNAMDELVRGNRPLPLWEPKQTINVESISREFIRRLNIPSACAPNDDLPDMLCHELGQFQEDNSLKLRLENLLGKESRVGSQDLVHAMTKIREHSGSDDSSFKEHLPEPKELKVGTRAASKTRAEKLRKQTAEFLMTEEGQKFTHALMTNQDIAACELLIVLLARLQLFCRFASTLTRVGEDKNNLSHKRSWLHLQLRPDLLCPEGESYDIFVQLMECISAVFVQEKVDSSQVKINVLTTLLQEVLTDINYILGNALRKQKNTLIIALDECQAGAKEMPCAFRSHDRTETRPFLRQLATCFGEIFSHLAPVKSSFIFTGTGLSKSIIYEALSSIVVKADLIHDVSDTGAFDNPKIQLQYIEKFLPPDQLEKPDYLRLRQRIVYWLRGRHRFTAEFISVMLQNGYKNLNMLLNQYIENLAGFEPGDYDGSESISPGIKFPHSLFLFEKLSKRMIEKIKSICYDYLLTSKLSHRYLGSDEIDYIQNGVARFKSSKRNRIIGTVDEPLVVLAGAIWFNKQPESGHTLYEYLGGRIDIHNPHTGRNGFEEFICFYLLKAFSQSRRLNEVFELKGDAATKLGNKFASLVCLSWETSGKESRLAERKIDLFDDSMDDSQSTPRLSGPIGLMIEDRDTSTLLQDWLSCKRHTPFCFPMNIMGPDIMCFLKLQDELMLDQITYICLAVQCKFYLTSSSLASCRLKKAIATITPSQFFAPRTWPVIKRYVSQELEEKDEPSIKQEKRNEMRTDILNALTQIPNIDPSAGRYGVVRIVCGFPIKIDLANMYTQRKNSGKGAKRSKRQKIETADPDGNDNHPIGKLERGALILATEDLHPTNYLDNITAFAREMIAKGKNYLSTSDPAVLGADPEEDIFLKPELDGQAHENRTVQKAAYSQNPRKRRHGNAGSKEAVYNKEFMEDDSANESFLDDDRLQNPSDDERSGYDSEDFAEEDDVDMSRSHDPDLLGSVDDESQDMEIDES
ncbi:hypothetical protein GYMLUDRAFT_56655 [Collybiopsis luxurians FD-317 M1]|nr:hypothetical protein GYMLUDRAFT_56655 [Collybiopsis luxurians FD-317 M1]